MRVCEGGYVFMCVRERERYLVPKNGYTPSVQILCTVTKLNNIILIEFKLRVR